MILKKLATGTTLRMLLLLVLILVPTYWRLLRPGIHSMHDFHIFRLYEYEKCVVDLQIPCRWSPDVSFAYGQPLYNFYGQLPYALGEIFRAINFSIIDSIKALFISSLIIAAWGMFFLGKLIWKNNWAALLSAIVYTYAPYRAVDIFVRGALPEALGFVFFPFLTYFFTRYILSKKLSNLIAFSFLYAGLITTHNLSAFMYLFFLIPWGGYLMWVEKSWNLLPKLILAALFTILLVSFYILPIALESKYVTLGLINSGNYDYRLHFVSLRQLLISRYWGYGGSVWGDDDRLSLAVGQIQWILPLLLLLLIVVKKQFKKLMPFFIVFLTGWLMIFLTHYKSEIVWKIIPSMGFVQFPWRFLGLAVFSFALASGVLMLFFKNFLLRFAILSSIVALLIILNGSFFFEDLWYSISDHDLFTGYRYQQQISSSVADYWPGYGSKPPSSPAPLNPKFLIGQGEGIPIKKTSSEVSYHVTVKSSESEVQFPNVYFPGWVASSLGYNMEVYPSGDLGLMTLKLPPGDNIVDFKFTNTPVRVVGNVISLATFILFLFWLVFSNGKKIWIKQR